MARDCLMGMLRIAENFFEDSECLAVDVLARMFTIQRPREEHPFAKNLLLLGFDEPGIPTAGQAVDAKREATAVEHLVEGICKLLVGKIGLDHRHNNTAHALSLPTCCDQVDQNTHSEAFHQSKLLSATTKVAVFKMSWPQAPLAKPFFFSAHAAV